MYGPSPQAARQHEITSALTLPPGSVQGHKSYHYGMLLAADRDGQLAPKRAVPAIPARFTSTSRAPSGW
jgi:hypothetical protein